MKLNTLLLTSAATLMVTTVAFAADLPSKKAAASSGAVQVCKVGGMTGFTLPGSDTCLQISGRVTVDFSAYNDGSFVYGSPLGSNGAINYRLNFDARSNSDLGVVRSFVSFTDNGLNQPGYADYGPNYTGVRKAFIQVGGFTAGIKDSLADISGTVGNYYGSGMSQSAYGVDYQVAVGNGMTLAIGAENNTRTNERPDLIARVSGSVGAVNYKLVGVSSLDDNDDSVTSILGHVDMSLGNGLSFYAFGGYGDDTRHVDGGSNDAGYYNSVVGAGLTLAVNKSLSLTVEGRSNDGDDWSSAEQQYSVSATYTMAKGLFIAPEVVMYDDGASVAFVRIQRDF